MRSDIDQLLGRLARQPFRARFHLADAERVVVDLRGLATVRAHAADLIGRRLAPAEPYKDGSQTPYRGHPVFVVQHATATCWAVLSRTLARDPEGPPAQRCGAGLRGRRDLPLDRARDRGPLSPS